METFEQFMQEFEPKINSVELGELRAVECVKNHVEIMRFFNDALKIATGITNFITKRIDALYSPNNLRPTIKSLPQLLYLRNLHFLSAAYKLSERGFVNPTRSLLRNVYETILYIYIFSLPFPNQKLIANKIIYGSEDKKEFNQKCSYANIQQFLYKGEKLNSLVEFYATLSESVHPHISALRAEIIYSSKIQRDNLLLGLGFSLCLIYALLHAENEIFSADDIKYILQRIKKIPPDLVDFDLQPNTNIEKKLKFHY